MGEFQLKLIHSGNTPGEVVLRAVNPTGDCEYSFEYQNEDYFLPTGSNKFRLRRKPGSVFPPGLPTCICVEGVRTFDLRVCTEGTIDPDTGESIYYPPYQSAAKRAYTIPTIEDPPSGLKAEVRGRSLPDLMYRFLSFHSGLLIPEREFESAGEHETVGTVFDGAECYRDTRSGVSTELVVLDGESPGRNHIAISIIERFADENPTDGAVAGTLEYWFYTEYYKPFDPGLYTRMTCSLRAIYTNRSAGGPKISLDEPIPYTLQTYLDHEISHASFDSHAALLKDWIESLNLIPKVIYSIPWE